MKVVGGKLPRWTADEDQALVEIVDDCVMNQDMTLLEAFEVAGELLNRPKLGIQFRWQTKIRQHLPDDLELVQKIRMRDPSNPEFAHMRKEMNQHPYH